MTASDRALVRRALAAVADAESHREAARRLGVAPKTVKDWREGRIPPLRSPMRTKLVSKLEGQREPNGVSAPAPYNEDREEEELARVGQLPDPLLRIMERESIAAVIRAQGLRDASRAARLEAEKAVDRKQWSPPAGPQTLELQPPPRRKRAEEGKEPA